MDPITAALNALSSFNQFLCTPEGQRFANINNDIIKDIFSKIIKHTDASNKQ